MIECIKCFLEVIRHPYCVLFLIHRSLYFLQTHRCQSYYFTVPCPNVLNLLLLLQNSCTSFSVFPCYSSSVSDFLPANWRFALQSSSLIKAFSCTLPQLDPTDPSVVLPPWPTAPQCQCLHLTRSHFLHWLFEYFKVQKENNCHADAPGNSVMLVLKHLSWKGSETTKTAKQIILQKKTPKHLLKLKKQNNKCLDAKCLLDW